MNPPKPPGGPAASFLTFSAALAAALVQALHTSVPAALTLPALGAVR